MKKTIIIVIVIVLAGFGIYLFARDSSNDGGVDKGAVVTPDTTEATSTRQVAVQETVSAIGTSIEGRDITAYNYGVGDTELLFIGGIHGGYEWNTVLVAYELMDYLKANPNVIPANVKVTVVPVLNPDGLNKTIGTSTRFSQTDIPAAQDKQVAGRFNANSVDLNRNFDCDWKQTGTWQNKAVSGGSKPFSEPESQSVKTYIEAHKPAAVIAWFSAAGGVYASSCGNSGVSADTRTITNTFASASGYPAYESFDFYETTGDMLNWLAKNNIPAISVLLTNHTDTEWAKNQKGVEAMLKYYEKK